MPSFSNAAQGSEAMDDRLEDMFRCPAVEQALQEQRSAARKRARTVIQQDLPAFIAHIVAIIHEAETDHDSIYHADRRKDGQFVASGVKLVHPKSYRAGQPVTNKSAPTQTSEAGDASFPASNDPSRTHEPSSLWMLNEHSGGPTEQEFGRPKPKRDDGFGTAWLGGLKSNPVCGKVFAVLSEESEKLMTMMKDLAHFLELHVPIMEDGNNFGVEVQQRVAKIVDIVLDNALKRHGSETQHYQDRMSLASSWNRYPNLEDHAAALAVSDSFDHFLAINAFRTLRNNAANVLRLMSNNWAKASDPKGHEAGKGGHAMGMY